MVARIVPLDAPLDAYQRQAEQLLDAWRQGDDIALRYFHEHLPRLLDDDVKWMPKRLSDEALRLEKFDNDDANCAIARGYDFADWPALADFAAAIARRDPSLYPFECAVEAVVGGDSDTLAQLLQDSPGLVHARSTRVTHFDPPVHRATLLHYVAANGVEGYRQKTPSNAVQIAKALLDAGADVDSLASLYGGECTTLSLLVSSCHPANAGLQAALAELLIDYGASLHDTGTGNWVSPVETALVFGYKETAGVLAKRGAPVTTLAAAAGLGRLDDVKRMLPAASAESRHRALALAAQLGHVDITRALLDAGEDPNRFNPPGTHSHTPPIHQAVWAGHLDVVRLLVERGARLDIRDKVHDSTPLGWARYGGKSEIAAYLEQHDTA
jgi:ankyrin repeat protein